MNTLPAMFIGTNGDSIIGEISVDTLQECIDLKGESPKNLKVVIPKDKAKRFDAMKMESIFIQIFYTPKGEDES